MVSEILQPKPLSGLAPGSKPLIPLPEEPIGYIGIEAHLVALADIGGAVVVAVGCQDLSSEVVLPITKTP